jgi:hypothetical protein
MRFLIFILIMAHSARLMVHPHSSLSIQGRDDLEKGEEITGFVIRWSKAFFCG